MIRPLTGRNCRARPADGGSVQGDNARLVAADRSSDPVIGTVVNGRFRVEKEIARGGMGRLYLAQQAHVNRLVALKVVAADEDDPDGHRLRRFLLEASILAKIQHPNVVTLFDYGRIEGSFRETYFIAMEYVHGENLAARLRGSSSLSVPQSMAILRQVVCGLREAHARGVIHRDLKPSNIVLGGDVAKIVDFGVGKVERDGDPLTRTGVLVGTPRYMAPEQFDGVSSSASDVYALGLVTYEMLVGRLPFSGGSAADYMTAKAQRPLRSMRNFDPKRNVPEGVEDLVARMLARLPRDRPSIDQIHRELQSGLSSSLHSSLGRARPRRPPPLPNRSAPAPLPSPKSITLTTLGATPAAHRRSLRKALLFVAAGLAAATVALRFVVRHAPSSTPAAVLTTTTAVVPAATAIPSFTLRIESIPSGASVTEDTTYFGQTPLEIPAGTSHAPRTFRLTMPGHSDVTFTQAVMTSNVARIVVMGTEKPAMLPPPKPTGIPSLDIRRRR